MSTPLKVKRNTWSIAEEKDFLLLCKEKAITDLLDQCVTSAGVSRQMRDFVEKEDSPILIKKVFKILPLRRIAT